jgi:hypothetical protein
MSYKWTEGEPRSANIDDGEEFNRGYEQYKGTLNGNLNRDNISHRSVDFARTKDNAFHKVGGFFASAASSWFLEGGEFVNNTTWPEASSPSNTPTFPGWTRKQYGGGWEHTKRVTLSGVKEGMLKVELHGWVQSSHILDNFKETGVEFKIAINGVDVVQTPIYYQHVCPIHAFVDVPVATGSVDADVYWRAETIGSNNLWANHDTSGAEFIYFSGMTILLINRYR